METTNQNTTHTCGDWTFTIRSHAVEVRDGARTVDRFLLREGAGSDRTQCEEWAAFAESYYPAAW